MYRYTVIVNVVLKDRNISKDIITFDTWQYPPPKMAEAGAANLISPINDS